MKRDTKRFAELYHMYLLGVTSITEEEEFFIYIGDPLYKDQIEELLSQSFDKQLASIYLEEYRRKRILDHIFNKAQIPTKKSIYHRISRHATVAASLLICLGAAFYLFRKEEQVNDVKHPENLHTDIVYLDSTQVYLTLDDGRRMVLSDKKEGRIAEQAGVIISKNKDGELIYTLEGTTVDTDQYNSVETPRGGQYQINLPDGTKVWLNAASSLTYPVSFSSFQERKVFLKGEGYFEVAPDRNKPFQVSIDGRQEVEVLGTHFNINAYGRAVKTALLEGIVKVSSPGIAAQEKSKILKPGQQSVNDEGQIMVTDIPYIASQVAWRDGYFAFNNANIKEIMANLSNWYDLEIAFQGDMSDIHFYGNYLRSRDVRKLLKSLELTNKVKFNIEGRRVTVLKGQGM